MEQNEKIIIYQTADGTSNLDVRLENETVWLTQAQMVELFQTTNQNINLHIQNIYREKELEEDSTVKDYLTVQKEGKRHVQRSISYYNLDVIISVGYRVKSRRGTQFRIWANRILKEYLVKGYAINDKLKLEQYEELKKTIKLLSNVIQNKELSKEEATGLLRIVTDYAYGLDVLDKYDYQTLQVEKSETKEAFHATYETAKEVIQDLKKKFEASKLFGNEKDQSFKSSIATIYQTFDDKDLYPSVEEKAAMLLYLVTKNHSFSDGNKRIAAFLFLWFLDKNNILYHTDGSKRIANNALVALTLMIAESRPEEKDMMVKVVFNLINDKN